MVYITLSASVISIAAAIAIPLSSPVSSSALPLRVRSETCGFVGNSDAYGLGIRLGIYFQWIASWIANQLSPEIAAELNDVNCIFLIAIFISGIVLSATPSNAYVVEILILLFILFGSVFSVLSTATIRTSKMGENASNWGACLRISLITAMSAYGVWYWFRGVRLLKPTPCESYIFLFSKVSIFGGARIFFQVLSVTNLIVYTLGFFIITCPMLPLVLAHALCLFVRFPLRVLYIWLHPKRSLREEAPGLRLELWIRGAWWTQYGVASQKLMNEADKNKLPDFIDPSKLYPSTFFRTEEDIKKDEDVPLQQKTPGKMESLERYEYNVALEPRQGSGLQGF